MSSSVRFAEGALPTLARKLRFLVGQDESGRWLALDERGMCGGVFRSREAALHYAEDESGHRRGAVRLASRALNLRF